MIAPVRLAGVTGVEGADGRLDEREVEIEFVPQSFPMMEMMQPPQGMEGTDFNFTEMLQEMLPKRTKRRTVKVPDVARASASPAHAAANDGSRSTATLSTAAIPSQRHGALLREEGLPRRDHHVRPRLRW